MKLEPDTELHAGERIDWSGGDGPRSNMTDADLNEKYVRGEVRIITEQGSLAVDDILSMVNADKYEINPDFQRRRRWNVEKQSRLIESLIMNVPIPSLFLYEDSYNHFQVMDGLQRLSTIADFYSNFFELEGLDEWPELNGRTYAQLPEQVRRGIDRRKLSTITLLRESASDLAEARRLKQMVFERINSGGIDLTPQETRNALFPGPMNSMCEELSRNSHFCTNWNLPPPDDGELESGEPSEALLKVDAYRRMDDVELVLRFFAHRQRTRLLKSGRLDRYLDRYLREANEFEPEVLRNLKQLFEETMELVDQVLGPKAFYLWRNRQGAYSWVERSTVVAYDPIMSAFSKVVAIKAQVISNKAAISEGLTGFFEENAELFDGRRTNAVDVQNRDEAVLNFLMGSIQDQS